MWCGKFPTCAGRQVPILNPDGADRLAAATLIHNLIGVWRTAATLIVQPPRLSST